MVVSRSAIEAGDKAVSVEQPAGTRAFERAGIGQLVIVDGTRQRDQERRPAGGGKFGHRRGPGAREHQMGDGEARRHVVEEGFQFDGQAGRTVGIRHRVQIFGPALLHDPQAAAQVAGDEGDAGRNMPRERGARRGCRQK